MCPRRAPNQSRKGIKAGPAKARAIKEGRDGGRSHARRVQRESREWEWEWENRHGLQDTEDGDDDDSDDDVRGSPGRPMGFYFTGRAQPGGREAHSDIQSLGSGPPRIAIAHLPPAADSDRQRRVTAWGAISGHAATATRKSGPAVGERWDGSPVDLMASRACPIPTVSWARVGGCSASTGFEKR